MKIKKELKTVQVAFRITPTMAKDLKVLNIDIAETCRHVLDQEIIKLYIDKQRKTRKPFTQV